MGRPPRGSDRPGAVRRYWTQFGNRLGELSEARVRFHGVTSSRSACCHGIGHCQRTRSHRCVSAEVRGLLPKQCAVHVRPRPQSRRSPLMWRYRYRGTEAGQHGGLACKRRKQQNTMAGSRDSGYQRQKNRVVAQSTAVGWPIYWRVVMPRLGVVANQGARGPGLSRSAAIFPRLPHAGHRSNPANAPDGRPGAPFRESPCSPRPSPPRCHRYRCRPWQVGDAHREAY